ncbi:MAG TPA: hypothetical protein VFP20_07965 [Bacteroidales bacterium]|nr:hypothetical protein [Bacteroidales bacterium]
MKKFLLTLLVFIVPVLLLMVTEVLLPSGFFAFRPWEGLMSSNKIPTYCTFYPNERMEMNSVGDLCHHTDHALIRKERWITDKLGYRNDAFVEAADILFIGDSFTVGTGLTQDDILSNKLRTKFGKGIRIYNMAPSSFSKFDYLLRLGVLKKPKLIVFEMVERNLPTSFYFKKTSGLKNRMVKNAAYGQLIAVVDKAIRFSSLKWLNARINHSRGSGRPAVDHSGMYFLQGKQQSHASSDLNRTVKIIKSYQHYCDSLDIKFLYLPMPDKETVYYDLVPLKKQSDYLVRLDSSLQASQISSIHTLALYNEFRKTHSERLYQLDDSHWNPTAVELVSEELFKVIHPMFNK